MLKFISFGSGSSGNCYYLATPDDALLVDLGVGLRGLKKDCEVKIVSTSGQLIWSGKSNGGFFSWNGCNAAGRRVSSGIYHIIVSTSDGQKAVVSRVAFIR